MQGVISSKEQEIIFYKSQVSDLARAREMTVEAEKQVSLSVPPCLPACLSARLLCLRSCPPSLPLSLWVPFDIVNTYPTEVHQKASSAVAQEARSSRRVFVLADSHTHDRTRSLTHAQLWKLKESLDWKTIAVQQMVSTLSHCQEVMKR